MRWTHFAAALIVAAGTMNCLAETPEFNRQRGLPNFQARLFGGQNWWTRYGEPVNSVALAQAEASPSDKVTGGVVPMYGAGYIYGPDTCDCSPPCVWDLWHGYFQDPKRCHPGGLGGRHCGACGGACGACGCGGFAKLYSKGCCDTCGGNAGSCSCAAPVSCTTAASDCGCKPVCGKSRHCHRGHRFMAHWNCGCNSCSAPLGCGCATPVAPAYPSEKQISSGPPVPLAEEAVLYPLPRLN